MMLLNSILILFACLFYSTQGVGMIYPTQYPQVSVLSQGLKSVYTLYFKVETSIAAGNFIKIQFGDYTAQDITPDRCVISYNSLNSWQQTPCSIINDPLADDLVLYIELEQAISNEYEENVIQIDLQNTNPISTQSSSIQIWTVSDQDKTNFFIYDLNFNFGQIPFTSENTEELQVQLLQYGTAQTINKPGSTNILRFAVQINDQIGDEDLQSARLKVVISSPWEFLTTSLVTAEQDPRFLILNPLTGIEGLYLESEMYSSPEIVSFSIETPNQISVVFSEDFQPGRSFIVQITDVQNPSIQSTGQLKIYTMNFNSNVVIEKNESVMDLEIFSNLITTELLPPVSVPFIGPVGFYKSTKEFITVKFSPDSDVETGYSLKIDFGSTNVVIQGSAYLGSEISASDASLPISYTYSGSVLLVQNIGALNADAEYYLTVRVDLSSVDANIQAKVSLDADPSNVTPLFYGETENINLKTNVLSILNEIQGHVNNDNGFLDIDPTVDSSQITFLMTTSDLDTDNGSYLEIYTTAQLTKGGSFGASSCHHTTIGAQFPSCTFETVGEYTVITLMSNAGDNQFYNGGGQFEFELRNLNFGGASNYQDLIYEFHFRLYRDDQDGSPFIDWISTPLVVQAAETNFQTSLMSNLNEVNAYVFPTLINLVNQNAATFSYSITGNEVRVITVWAHQTFKSLVQAPNSYEDYSCGSNLVGVTCQYVEGDADQDAGYFLSWDRIDIYLPESASSQTFHVIIPDLFADAGYTYTYDFSLGTYDSDTRTYRYLTRQPQIQITPTEQIANFAIDVEQQVIISLAGYAGSDVDNVSLIFDSKGNAHEGNNGNKYGSAIIMITDWEIWIQDSSTYTNAGSINVLSDQDDENSPITLMYWDFDGVQHFITVFPLIDDSSAALTDTLYLDNLLLPFTFDIPNHNFYVTNADGHFKGYSQYFNVGYGELYSNTLTSLDVQCEDLSEGILNTFCQISFLGQYNIQKNAQVFLNWSGINVYTDNCNVYYTKADNTQVQLESATCSMNLEADEMIIILDEESLLPKELTYTVEFYGVEISSNLLKTLNLSVRDYSGRFVIEEKLILLTTTSSELQDIQITEIEYKEINPYVFSSLYVKFTTPRSIYPNEEVALDMGTDLNDVNTNTDRLSVQLFRISDGSEIQIAVNFVQQKMNVLFFDKTLFTADSYELQINNIRNPASNDNDFFKILFVRTYDSTLVLTNTEETTADFPQFIERTNSQITLEESNYLQEGALQELVFDITMQDSKMDSNTEILINFPLYYSPAITNFEDLLHCSINGINIKCEKDSSAPYRLKVSNSPLNIFQGEQFTLKVFGVISPMYTLQQQSLYTQETIFVGVNSGLGLNYYTEFIHLNPPQVVVQPTTGYVYLQHVDIPVKNSGSLSDHSIKFFTDETIPANSGILIVFPKAYKTLVITSQLDCYVKLESGSETTSSACVVEGRTLKLETGDEIPAESYFYIEIAQVPTPAFLDYDPTAIVYELNMNDIIIQVYDLTTKAIIVRNFYLTNRMNIIEFEKLNNVLTINSIEADNKIQVVKGTYSQPITIKTPDDSRYITNLQLDAAATGFTFLPNQLLVFLGDFETNLRIGAHKNLQEKAYSFTVTMEEKYFKEFYSIANTYVIYVTSEPISITIPQTVEVPRGGCSLPEVIEVTSAPYDDMEIAIQYDYSQYPEEVFYLDLELSSYILLYTSEYTYRYASFCITDSYEFSRRQLQTGEMKIGLHVGGQNSDAYQLQYSEITMNIISKNPVAPTLGFTENTIGRTTFLADVDVPCNGVLYWHLYVKDTAKSLSLNQLKFYVKYQNLVLQSSNDSQDNVLGIKVDERVGLAVYRDGVTPHELLMENLQPETDYELCGYFENEFKTATEEQTCISFRTSDWELFTKVTISFTKNTYEDMMNDILCFYIRKVQTRIFNIIEASGTSCSFGVSPDFYYYKYNGQTYSNSDSQTNIYLIPDLDIETDIALDTLADFYDGSKQLKQSIIDEANDDHQIDFINSGIYIKKFQYSEATSASGDFSIPDLNSITFKSVVTTTEASIQVKDISLSHDGVVYMILDRIFQLEFDPVQDNFQEFPVNINKNPTAAQVVACTNAFGTPAQKCIRAVVNNDSNVEALFEDLLFESGYIVYYVLANEYPLNPIFGDKVYQKQVNVGFRAGSTDANILKIPSLILLIILIALSIV